ncbi:lysophospholipase [Aspergillus sclerotiicarbonarius CBS 121057]|uniref:Lysophospholipase n=1 Tax=Aspergillus sclerotiicarbonarius (strain CBS 121057 / IBT 28362) TaxID=1448318 RepID=A0A319E965_ASPSB|nr:lysophospholipase [Aspergillus sclerotiicarbonarius CBS 121057]
MVSKIALPVFLAAATALASNSSTDSYAPYYVDCPEDIQLVRQPRSTSLAESEWVHGRKAQIVEALGRYLWNLDLGDFDTAEYMDRVLANIDYNVPVIGWANSGGGWRSATTGVGGLQAIDERTAGAREAKVGGLFQMLTYIAGLSGGSWPVSSPTFHDYEPIGDMVADWQLDVDRFTEDTVEGYFEVLVEKYEAGFNISVADMMGRGFAAQTIPGVNRTWSSIPEMPGFKSFSGPFPILIASSINRSSPVEDGLYVPSWEAPWYEWNPFEFGSWKLGFVPTKYVGTVPNENNTAEQCVVNLDQASFVLGSVASAWNYWYLEAVSNDTLGTFSKRNGAIQKRDSNVDELVELVDEVFSEFFNYTVSQISNPSIPNAFNPDENLTLADGSEAGQSIPFLPLIQPDRKLDFIMAWDDDADDEPYTWNNGTNIYDSYVFAKAHGLPFPEIPPVREMLARNYTIKPVLFGCDTNLTTTRDATSPIVAYFANAPYSWYSNFSWSTTTLSSAEANGIMQNSFNLLTQGNGTLDSTWTECLGCAAIDRSLARVGMQRSQACEQCFQEHCWDGTLTAGVSEDFVLDPSLALDPSLGYAEWTEEHPDME